MNNKVEEYFIFHKTLAACLAVVVGCDPNPLNVLALVLFTSVELIYRVLCYGSSLLVKFSPACPRGEPRMALLYFTGTKEAVWAVKSLFSKQRHQQSHQASYIPADGEWETERKIKSLESGMD